MSWKGSLLVTWKILRLFVNALTANAKYSLLNRGILTQQIQMHLSQKQKHFSDLFRAFFKSALNFKHFQKMMTLIAYVFPKLRTLEDMLTYISIKSRLRGPFDRQHGQLAERQIQSKRQQLYHIHSSL